MPLQQEELSEEVEENDLKRLLEEFKKGPKMPVLRKSELA